MTCFRIKFTGYFFACLLAVVGDHASAQESKTGIDDSLDWSGESRELFGYLESAFANASAIRKGDCLFRVEEFFDSVNYRDRLNLEGLLDRSETWVRFRFDYDANKASIALASVVERTDMGLDDPNQENKGLRRTAQKVFAYCIDPELESKFSFINGRFSGKRYLAKNAGAREMRSQRIPELRSLGWTGGVETNNYSLFKSWLRGAESGRHLLELRRRSAGQIEFRKYAVAKRDLEREHYYSDFTVDLRDLTIISTASFHHYGKSGVVNICSPQCHTKWQEVSGIQVPVQVRYSTIDLRSGASGKENWGDVDHRMDIHWFSLNEPVAPTAFDGSEIQTAATIRNLLDPERNGATSLVTLLRRGKPEKVKPEKQRGKTQN